MLAGEKLFIPTEKNFRPGNRIRDITDGDCYRAVQKKSRQDLVLGDHEVLLSLVVNTDGLSINDSGAQSAWPVFMTIAEISHKRRFWTDKIVNYALWQGTGKPPISSILKSFQKEMEEISGEGKKSIRLELDLKFV